MSNDVEDNGLHFPAERNGRTAMLLALAGFIPVAVLSVWLAAISPDHPWHGNTIFLLKTYAALILAFLGGIRWGLATRDDDDRTPRLLAFSTIPQLVGWGALALPDMYAFALLAAAFAAHGAWDQFAVHNAQAPDWFGKLRMRLTMLVTAAMIVAMIAVA
ncbi:MAG: DUF3429 domain-containing protein [Notoacmeibacter sp.]|nr:DUF3429 domain-containing protein [Notoacmeibacter sp.]